SGWHRQYVLQTVNGAVGAPHLRRQRSENLDRSGNLENVFLDRDQGHSAFGHSQYGGFVTEAHIAQSEISHEAIIFRLFFEERFQFTARLPPTFMGSGMLTGDFLRPA